VDADGPAAARRRAGLLLNWPPQPAPPRDVPIPLYQQLAEDLVRQIRSGKLPVGSLLPPELELASAYGASRNTVRSALRQLQDMGLISRRRNRGTMVQEPPAQGGAYVQSMSTLEDLVALAQNARREVQGAGEVVLDIETARLLKCPPGARMFRISMTRRESESSPPLVWTDAYIDPHYRQVLRRVRAQPDVLVCDLIEKYHGRRIAVIEQITGACAIPAAIAPALHAQAGDPALRVVRYYRDAANAIVEVTVSTYPAHRYSIATTLVRAR